MIQHTRMFFMLKNIYQVKPATVREANNMIQSRN